MNAVVETRGLCKQYGPAPAGQPDLDLTVPGGGGGLWISGPQRGGGQIHHPQAASGAGQAHGRGNDHLLGSRMVPAPA